MINNKRIVCFVLLICAAAMGWIFTACGAEKTDVNNTASADQPATTPDKTQSEKSSQTELKEALLPDGAEPVDVEKCLIISDDLSLEVPSQLKIYDNEMIIIDEQMGAEMIRNLSDNGWNEHRFDAVEDGFYFIGCHEKKSGIPNKEDYQEVSQAFMDDSGLSQLFADRDIALEYELQGENGQYTSFYWLTEQNQKTGSYLRINLEDKRTCGECKMYLYDSTVIDILPSVTIEEALEKVFYFPHSENQLSYEYNVSYVKLIYKDGLPYYCYTGMGVKIRGGLEVYALAVSLDDIRDNEALMSKYLHFRWP